MKLEEENEQLLKERVLFLFPSFGHSELLFAHDICRINWYCTLMSCLIGLSMVVCFHQSNLCIYLISFLCQKDRNLFHRDVIVV